MGVAPSAWRSLAIGVAAMALSGAWADRAHAGDADAVSELHVKIAISAPKLVNINLGLTAFNEGSKTGYGIHDEEIGGEAFVLLKSYDTKIFAKAFAESPPTSDSRSSFGEVTGQIGTLDNFSDSPTSVTISFSADLFLDAAASGAHSYAAASGAYLYTGSGSAPSLKFNDRQVARVYGGQSIVADYPKEQSFTFMLPAQGTFRLFYGGGAVGALAHASDVPEPDTWAFMLAGLLLVGCDVRRRKASIDRSVELWPTRL